MIISTFDRDYDSSLRSLSSSVYKLSNDEEIPGIKLKARKAQAGPELRLVHRFLRHGKIEVKLGHEITVFLEPGIVSGYPDIVIVVWEPDSYESEGSSYAPLGADELAILGLTHLAGEATLEMVGKHFSAKGKRAAQALVESGILSEDARGSLSRQDRLGVRKIIAIEAKIGKSRDAVHQAFRNQVFATESYVLLDTLPDPGVVEWAGRLGVGIFFEEPTGFSKSVGAKERNIGESAFVPELNEWLRLRSLPREIWECQLM